MFLAARPRVRPDLVAGPCLVRGAARIHLLKDPLTGRRMEFGPKEHFLIARLDGNRTLAEIGWEYADEFGSRLGEAQWGQLLRLLGGRGLLAGGPPPVPVVAPTPPRSGIIAGRTRLVADAPALMDRLHHLTAPARRPAVLAGLLVLAVALLVAVAVQAGILWRQTEYVLTHQPVLLLAVGCVLWCSLALHEIAHGVFARAWGGRVSEIGLRWVLGATYLYCRVEDVQFLGSRARKVATAGAGGFVNLLFLVPFYPLWALLPEGSGARAALGTLLLLGAVIGIANFLPLPPLDGYQALGHALRVSGLADGSRTFAGLAVRSWLRRGPGIAAYPPRLRLLYGGFVLLTAVQSAALLAVVGLVLAGLGQAALAWWLPVALLGAVLVLWALGTLGRRVRAIPSAAVPAAATPNALSTSPRKGEMSGPDTDTEADHESGTVVAVDGVTKRYGDVRALDGVTLAVRHGEFFGILGPNGAGKTTLVEIVEGMRRPDSGTVTVLGASPWPRDTALLARIGVQTQASAFFTRLTAGEHLRTVAALYRMDPAAARTALARVALTDKENARIEQLSGGQRQRLALATALLNEPELIFLDEPTAALDPEARRELWGLLRSLRSEGRTIICTTHYLDEAEALCDRVAIIAAGRVVALDTPRNLIRSLHAPARLLLPAGELPAATAEALDGVDRVSVEGDELVIETTAVSRVLTELGGLVDIATVTVRTATLEDAYLTLTGTGTEHSS
jgi:ABC-type multidrug transport system ATPase subunit/Zn-dependent protease